MAANRGAWLFAFCPTLDSSHGFSHVYTWSLLMSISLFKKRENRSHPLHTKLSPRFQTLHFEGSRISATSPGTLPTISLTAPCFTSNPKIPGNFVVGTAFLSLILSALVYTLKLIRKSRSLPSRLSLVRYRFESSGDFRNADIYNLKKKFLMDMRVGTSSFRLLGNQKVAIRRGRSFRPMPLGRGSYNCALEVPDRALVGFLKYRITEPSFPIVVPFGRESVGCRPFQSLMVSELYIMGGRKADNIAVMHIGTARANFSNVEEETVCVDDFQQKNDMLNVNDSGDRRFFLPEASVALLEILPSTIEEKEELPASNEVQAAIPAIAMVAGILGALVAGESGCLEMVGFVAITSFVVYDLLWASIRKMLWHDLGQITDREKFVSFLLSRKIITNVSF